MAETQDRGGWLDRAALMPAELRVLVADDRATVRELIRDAIEPRGLRVVAEASGADDAVALSAHHRPDVCIVAADLPGGGLETTRSIKRSAPDTKVVMTTEAGGDEDLLEALRAGADGYLLMTTPPSRLPEAIRGVAQGEAVLPRAMTGRLIREFRERGLRRRVMVHPDQAEVELTAREFEVFQRLRRHEPTSQIASRLGISQVTVRRHVGSVLQKLEAPDRRRAIEMLEQADEPEPQVS